MTCQILISESQRFSAQALEVLRSVGDVDLADLDRTGLLEKVRDKEVLWVRLRTRIDEEILTAGRSLKIVATPTTGLNHIDLDAAERRGIKVMSLRGDVDFLNNVCATAELTIGLMLSLLRNIPAANAHVLEGGWNRDLFVGREIRGATIGIVGYGRLGRMVAHRLKAFGARVIACDPQVRQEVNDIPLLPLHDLLRESDGVSLHVDLNRQTAGFFGAKELAEMREGAWLVNTARGELIDESALLEALWSGKLAGAALDVVCDESGGGMQNHPLVRYARTRRNLILTPHLGGCTHESMEKTELHLAAKLRDALQSAAAPQLSAIGC